MFKVQVNFVWHSFLSAWNSALSCLSFRTTTFWNGRTGSSCPIFVDLCSPWGLSTSMIGRSLILDRVTLKMTRWHVRISNKSVGLVCLEFGLVVFPQDLSRVNKNNSLHSDQSLSYVFWLRLKGKHLANLVTIVWLQNWLEKFAKITENVPHAYGRIDGYDHHN